MFRLVMDGAVLGIAAIVTVLLLQKTELFDPPASIATAVEFQFSPTNVSIWAVALFPIAAFSEVYKIATSSADKERL